jgi:hypothetical protein
MDLRPFTQPWRRDKNDFGLRSRLAVGLAGAGLGRVFGARAAAWVVAEGNLTDHRPDAEEDHRDHGV